MTAARDDNCPAISLIASLVVWSMAMTRSTFASIFFTCFFTPRTSLRTTATLSSRAKAGGGGDPTPGATGLASTCAQEPEAALGGAIGQGGSIE